MKSAILFGMADSDLEKELNESIAYFEQILNVLPGERTALEFLCVACMQLGDKERFLKHAIALAELDIRESNVESAAVLIERLKTFDDPRAKEVLLKLQVVTAPKPDLQFERPDQRVDSSTPSVAAKAELVLLERLVAEGVLSRGLVQVAFDQLNSLPAGGGDFLISALYILEKENLTGAAEAIAAVADAAHAPPVPLDAFDLVPAQVRQLPDRLIKVRGVIPFAKLCDEWAVAVLNPLDEVLKAEISSALNAKCHFFLLLPNAVDKVIERVFKQDEEAEPEPQPVKPAPVKPAPVEPAPVEPTPEPTPEPQPEPAPAESSSKPKIGLRRPAK